MRDYGTTNNTPAHQAPPVWRAPEGLEDLTAAQVGGGGACQHTNDKPERSGAPRGLRGLAGHHTDTPTDWRPPRGLRGLAAVPVGGGGAAPLVWRTPEGPAAVLVGGGRAWPGFEIDHSERSSRVAISRAGRRPPAHTAARPNKTSHAAAGPGRASRRHAEPIISTPCSTCVEGAGGPGRGAGGRRQGLAGLRDRPLRAQLACGDLAGGTPPTGTNTQAQTLSHKYIGTTKPPGPTGGRAAHASGR